MKQPVLWSVSLRTLVLDLFCPSPPRQVAGCSRPVARKVETLTSMSTSTSIVAHVRIPCARMVPRVLRLDLEYNANAQEDGKVKLAQSDIAQRNWVTVFEATEKIRTRES